MTARRTGSWLLCNPFGKVQNSVVTAKTNYFPGPMYVIPLLHFLCTGLYTTVYIITHYCMKPYKMKALNCFLFSIACILCYISPG